MVGLAVSTTDAVGREGYLRTTMLERRRKVMADWAAFLAGESAEAKVAPFKGKRLAATQEGST